MSHFCIKATIYSNEEAWGVTHNIEAPTLVEALHNYYLRETDSKTDQAILYFSSVEKDGKKLDLVNDGLPIVPIGQNEFYLPPIPDGNRVSINTGASKVLLNATHEGVIGDLQNTFSEEVEELFTREHVEEIEEGLAERPAP